MNSFILLVLMTKYKFFGKVQMAVSFICTPIRTKFGIYTVLKTNLQHITKNKNGILHYHYVGVSSYVYCLASFGRGKFV